MTRIPGLTGYLIWRVNPVDSDFFSFSSLVFFFRFHLLILYAVHSEKADAFSFFFFFAFFSFYVFHCGLHNAVHGEKADAFF
jgi:1-acyl-sn-glycerol-3-phosphate acyltransferase